MARLLFVVERTWLLEDYFSRLCGLGDHPHMLLAPGIVVEPGERFRPGGCLLMKRPDGSTLDGRIAGFVMMHYRNRDGNLVEGDYMVAITDLESADVPIGTEVWSVDPPSRGRGGRVAGVPV
jgi:hypothetical protein